VAGRVQVSASTREHLDDRVEFEEREIEVKGLGRLTAYVRNSLTRYTAPILERLTGESGGR
jgi:hypothetical protein